MEKEVEVLIIGGGPIGLACGIEAKKVGLSHLIIERGCLANSIYHYPLNMTFFSTSERLEIGDVPFVSHLHKPNRTEALEYYRRVAMHWRLSLLLYTEVTEIKRDSSQLFCVATSKGNHFAKSVIIATGFYDLPNKMGVVGEELPKVKHYYHEPHPYFNQKVAIIGAANSAIDAALECYRKGAEVTLIVRGDKISERVKYWVKPDIENRIKEGSIKAHFNSFLLEITPESILVQTPEGPRQLVNDAVLAMTGYLPDFSLLEKIGIDLRENKNRTPVYDPISMETNVEDLYLAGVICGGLATHEWFIENSREHARLIVKNILRKMSLV